MMMHGNPNLLLDRRRRLEINVSSRSSVGKVPRQMEPKASRIYSVLPLQNYGVVGLSPPHTNLYGQRSSRLSAPSSAYSPCFLKQ